LLIEVGCGGKAPTPSEDGEGSPVLDKFEKYNHRLSGWFEWIGLAAILLIMVITCIDVVGAKVFSWRLFGAIDIVMLSQIVAIAFAASMTMILGRHIQVEFVIARLPKRTQAVIDSIVLLLGLGLFSLIVWRLCVLGYTFQTSGEHSQSAYIPYYPFAYCIALASISVCLVLLLKLLKSIRRIIER
jgi:TRAP-type C4-dicarboxylate transport system permease small subunit